VSSRYGYITKAELIESNYKLVFLQILSTLIIYGGYFITKSTYLKIKPRFASIVSKKRLVVWAFVCLFISYGFFLTQGGVMAWVNNWGLAGGRDEATAGFGPILSFIGGLYYIPALWLLFKNKKAFNDVLFWVFTVIFTLGCFVVTGSRYAVLQALTIYLMAWVLLNRNFPIGKVFLGGCGFVVLFGMLGMLRTSGGFTGGAADWSVLNGDVSSYVDYALADAANRVDAHTDLTIVQKVPDKVDYLYGQSYLSVISAYVPRAIWPDKPHTGAYYTGYYIFNVQWGVPPGEVGEAYWNFGYIGFILFFFMKGALYKIIVNTFTKYYMYPAVAVIYFVLLFDGGSFVSLALTDLLRELIFLIIGLKILKLL
jgi:oligosaccharide repeat unit polymerase